MAQLKTGYRGNTAVRQSAEGRSEVNGAQAERPDSGPETSDVAALEARAEAEIQRFIQSGELCSVDPQEYAGPPVVVPARERAEPSAPAPRPSPPESLAQMEQPDAIVGKPSQPRRQDPAEHLRLPEPETATSKEDKRLTIARIAAQRAESALSQMTRQLERTEANLAARTTELAHARAAHEEERARWADGPITGQGHKAARAAKFERRTRIALRLVRDLALTVLVVALAILATQHAVPVAKDVWRHKSGPNSDVRPLFEKVGLAKGTASAAHATVAAPTAHLRSRPASGASVVGTLSHDERVTLLRRHGKWMLVQTGDTPNQQQGWVTASSLEDAP